MKTRVLFLCIGNSCRSQMAEGFAKKYGTDVIDASSAGLAPATTIADLTQKVMSDRNISLEGHFPKDLRLIDPNQIDLLINLSGQNLKLKIPTQDWTVSDPIGQSEAIFQRCAQDIENRVMRLILELRQRQKTPKI